MWIIQKYSSITIPSFLSCSIKYFRNFSICNTTNADSSDVVIAQGSVPCSRTGMVRHCRVWSLFVEKGHYFTLQLPIYHHCIFRQLVLFSPAIAWRSHTIGWLCEITSEEASRESLRHLRFKTSLILKQAILSRNVFKTLYYLPNVAVHWNHPQQKRDSN